MGKYEPIHIGGDKDFFSGNNGLGRYVFMPGSMDRAEKIAANFEEKDSAKRRTEHTVWIGKYKGIDVAAVSSGMGPGSAGIIVPEIINCDVKRILRVGSCGAKQYGIKVGSCIIATGSVRDEATSDAYVPREYPAIAHPDAVLASKLAAKEIGIASSTYAGIVHTKTALEREIKEGSLQEPHDDYMKILRRSNVIASSMEESVLFVLSSAMTHRKPIPVSKERSDTEEVRAGCVLAVYGDPDVPYASKPERTEAEKEVIKLALESIVQWAEIDKVVKRAA